MQSECLWIEDREREREDEKTSKQEQINNDPLKTYNENLNLYGFFFCYSLVSVVMINLPKQKDRRKKRQAQKGNHKKWIAKESSLLRCADRTSYVKMTREKCEPLKTVFLYSVKHLQHKKNATMPFQRNWMEGKENNKTRHHVVDAVIIFTVFKNHEYLLLLFFFCLSIIIV